MKNSSSFGYKIEKMDTPDQFISRFVGNGQTSDKYAKAMASLAGIKHCKDRGQASFLNFEEVQDDSTISHSVMFIPNDYTGGTLVPSSTTFPEFSFPLGCFSKFRSLPILMDLFEIPTNLIRGQVKDGRGGLLIKSIEGKNPTALKVDDVFISVGPKRVDKISDFYQTISQSSEQSEIRIIRQSKVMRLKVRLANYLPTLREIEQTVLKDSCKVIKKEMGRPKDLPGLCLNN